MHLMSDIAIFIIVVYKLPDNISWCLEVLSLTSTFSFGFNIRLNFHLFKNPRKKQNYEITEWGKKFSYASTLINKL